MMLDSSSVRTAVILAFTVAVSSACGGSGTGAAPVGGSAPFAASEFSRTSVLDVSGQYAGTVKDSVYGSGQIYGDLAQYQGAVGGTLLLVFPNSLVFGTPASFLLKGRSLTGSGVLGTPSSVLCPTSESATYTLLRHLNGSYTVRNGCSSNAGTFTMKQICTYKEGPAMEIDARLKRC